MAEPISVGTAVSLGLKSVETIHQIFKVVDGLKHAPDRALTVYNEISDIRNLLSQFQRIILTDTADFQGCAADVRLTDIATVVVHTTQTLSRMERFIKNAKVLEKRSLLDRSIWLYHEADVNRVVRDLQQNKASLTAVLTIFQSEMVKGQLDRQIEHTRELRRQQASISELHKLVRSLVAADADLDSIMNRSGNISLASGGSTIPTISIEEEDSESLRTIRNPQINAVEERDQSFETDQSSAYDYSPSQESGSDTLQTGLQLQHNLNAHRENPQHASQSFVRPFEIDLFKHRVYRRAAQSSRSSVISNDNSNGRGVTWSFLSELTVTHISCISVLSLPMTILEHSVLLNTLENQDTESSHITGSPKSTIEYFAEMRKSGRLTWISTNLKYGSKLHKRKVALELSPFFLSSFMLQINLRTIEGIDEVIKDFTLRASAGFWGPAVLSVSSESVKSISANSITNQLLADAISVCDIVIYWLDPESQDYFPNHIFASITRFPVFFWLDSDLVLTTRDAKAPLPTEILSDSPSLQPDRTEITRPVFPKLSFSGSINGSVWTQSFLDSD